MSGGGGGGTDEIWIRRANTGPPAGSPPAPRLDRRPFCVESLGGAFFA